MIPTYDELRITFRTLRALLDAPSSRVADQQFYFEASKAVASLILEKEFK